MVNLNKGILILLFLAIVLVQGVHAAETYTFVTKWGSEGSGDGQFKIPSGVAVDSSGNVYVADMQNNRIQKFSSDGTFLTKWGSEGYGDGQFGSPKGVAVDSSGNVYVADDFRIQKFSSDGTFLTKFGSRGFGGDGQFIDLYGVAVDSSGNVYGVDLSNSQIQKFSSTGTFLTKWGSYGTSFGQFKWCDGVAVDSSGNVYVSEYINHRIQKFSSTGSYLTQWGGGSPGSGNGQFIRPSAVAVDSSGNVYVADHTNFRIQKFSSTGSYLTQWGDYGTGDGTFLNPSAVAVDSSGNVYVADENSHRIQKFAIQTVPPTTVPPTLQPLSATAISPSAGINSLNISTTVTGTGFKPGAVVRLTLTGQPDIVASSVTLTGDSIITCTFDLTGKIVGQWNVEVTNPDELTSKLPNAFTITGVVPPTLSVTAISPSAGINSLNISTTVTGTGFKPGAVVKLTLAGQPDIVASGVTLTGDSIITCTFDLTGKEAEQWNVVVTNPDGTSATLPGGFAITGVVPPTLSVTAISPSAGINDQSISATVTGTGFKPGVVVKLTLMGQPDIVASGVTLIGNSTLTCTFDLTGKTTGIWDLAVTNPGDGTTSIRSTAFTLTLLPPINGTIIVSSTPQDALVYLDGSLKGTGSFTLQEVSPGYHSVRVSKIMYNDYVTDVRVMAGSPSYVNAVLTPVSGTSGIIIASSNPAGANVYLDGMDKGISPVTITGVSSGSHTVSFTKTGYSSASRSVTMTAGQTMDITADLTKTGGDWGDLLNTTTLIIVGIVVLIIVIIGYLLRKKKNRWDNS